MRGKISLKRKIIGELFFIALVGLSLVWILSSSRLHAVGVMLALRSQYWLLARTGIVLLYLVCAFFLFSLCRIRDLQQAARRRSELEQELSKKRSETAIANLELRYADLVNNIPFGIYRTSPGVQGKFFEANPAFISMVEAGSKEELFKHPVSALYQDPFSRQSFSDKVLAAGLVKNEELELKTFKGRLFTAAVTVVMKKNDRGEIYFDGVMQDITPRKRMEEELEIYQQNLEELVGIRTEELKGAEEKINFIIESANEGITVSDDAGHFEIYNKAMERLCGYSLSEVHASGDLSRLLYPDDAVRGRALEGVSALVSGASASVSDSTIVTKAGQQKRVLVSTSVLMHLHRRIFLTVWHDFSERYAFEQQLTEQARVLAEKSRQLARRGKVFRSLLEDIHASRALLLGEREDLVRSNQELEQFAYIISHDLREPLRMVASFTQLLERRYKNRIDADANDFIGYVVDGTRRMQQLIDDLLDYSRVGTHDLVREPVDSSSVLEEVRENLRIVIEENTATLQVGTLPVVLADKTQLVQLFQNFLVNAIKFRSRAVPLIRVAARVRENDCLFSIADNGIGFPQGAVGRIFKIFQRLHTQDEYPGTGIGLAICKKIVERHGGKIWAESPGEGKGATFYFTIPKG